MMRAFTIATLAAWGLFAIAAPSYAQQARCYRYGNGMRCETDSPPPSIFNTPAQEQDRQHGGTITECYRYGNGTQCETRRQY